VGRGQRSSRAPETAQVRSGARSGDRRRIASAGLLVERVPAVPAAVLLHLESFAIVDLRLHRDVVALFALGALEGDLHPLVGLGHLIRSLRSLGPAGRRHHNLYRVRPGSSLAGAGGAPTSMFSTSGYLMILVTRPAPTVRPPSRIANRRPSSIAIGLPNSTVIVTLSPGITISVPDGN